MIGPVLTFSYVTQPPAVTEAIIRLLRNPDLRREMDAAGRERVERHLSVESMVQATEALYEELVGEKMGMDRA